MTSIPKAIGPYATYRIAGNLLFTSGQLPINPLTGEITATTIEDQTKQSLENIKAILAKENLTLTNILKTTVYLKNIEDFTKMNEIYAQYFTEPYPARSAFEVARLPKDGLVEIECIATLQIFK